MSKNTGHNDVIIARQNTSNVASLLSLAHLDIIGSQIQCMSTKQEKASLKGNTSPHGGLRKDHRHRLPFKRQIVSLP